MTDIAQSMARNWVGCYTSWVGAEAAERRRAEIEADLWDQLADARERAVPPSAVALSITRRVVAGIPADLHWTHTQRLAERGRPAQRKARLLMTAFGRLAATWWWTLPAAALSVIYIWMAVGNLQMPGIPYLDGAIQALALAALMIAGVALLRSAPRLAGILAVAGGLTGIAIWWSPVIQVLSLAVSVGAAITALKQTDGTRARALAGAGLLILGVAPIGFVVSGALASLTALQALALVAAAAGAGLLVASGRTRGVATA